MFNLIKRIYHFNLNNFKEEDHSTLRLGNLLAFLSFIITSCYSLFYLIVLDSAKASMVNEFFAICYLLHFYFIYRKNLDFALLSIIITYLCQMFYIVVFFASNQSGFQYYYILAGPTIYFFFRTKPVGYRLFWAGIAFVLFVLCEILGEQYAELNLNADLFRLLYFSTTSIVFILLVLIIHTFQKEIDSREEKLKEAAENLSGANKELNREIEYRIDVQKKVEESEKRFRTIFNQAAVGVALTNTLTGKLIKVNNKYCEITGYTEEELRNKTFLAITHPDDRESDMGKMNDLKAGKIDFYSIEKRYIRPDKSVVWANLTVSSMWRVGDRGDAQHIGIIQDISDRKFLEGEVKTLEGIIPICSSCKNIRDDEGYWSKIESYIQSHSEASFSHGICPECTEKIYGKEEWYLKIKKRKESGEDTSYLNGG